MNRHKPIDKTIEHPSDSSPPRSSDNGGSTSLAGTRYEVLGEIARGGMGAILRARDLTLQRELAIKVIKEGLPSTSETLRRFIEEARISGQLQHPGIVPVHELGRFPDGRYFFAMKLIQGETLQDLLQKRPNPAHELPRFLKIFEQVCQTLAFAHSRRVIHRDLKPLNIMVGAFGEVQVMDWGLAKVLVPKTGDSAMRSRSAPNIPAKAGETFSATSALNSAGSGFQTQVGSILGTPSYMAPEQARGDIDTLDERADVFGLGAILCVILTGKPPYAGSNVSEILSLACAGDVTHGFDQLDQCGAEPELIALARTCLAPDLSTRLRDGQAVARGITAYLEGVSERLKEAEIARATVQAKAEAARLKAEAEQKRRRVRLTLGGIAALVLLVGIGGTLVLRQQAETRRRETASAVEVALTKAEQLESQGNAMPTADAATAEAAFHVWKEAAAAVEEAEAALRTGAPDAETLAAVQARKEKIDAGLEAAEKTFDRRRRQTRLLLDLEAMYLRPYAEVNAMYFKGPADPDWREVVKTFEAFGIDPMSGDEKALGEALKDTPQALRDRAILALDEAAEYLKLPRLTQVANHIPQDPLVARYRATFGQEAAAINKVLETTDFSKISPTFARDAAKWYRNTGDHEAAVRLQRAVQSYHPDDFWCNFELGISLAYGGRPTPAQVKESIGFLRTAVALRPRTYSVQLSLANVLNSAADVDAADQAYNRLLELFPDEPGVNLHAANFYGWVRKDFKRAAQLAARAVKKEPNGYRNHSNLGVMLAMLGDKQGSIAAGRKAVELSPDDPGAHAELLFVLNKAGDNAAFREATRVAPLEKIENHHQHVLVDVVSKCREADDLKTALRAARRLTELTPDDPSLLHTVVPVLESTGDKDRVDAVYKQLLERFPDNPEMHVQAAYFYGWTRKDFKKGAELAARVVEKEPKYDGGHSCLGVMRAMLGDKEGALAAARKGVELAPYSPGAHRELLFVLKMAGDNAAYCEAARAAPLEKLDLPLHLADVVSVCKEAGELKTAVRAARRLTEVKQDDPKLFASLASLCRSTGDDAGTRAAFQKAAQLEPNNPNWAADAARVLVRLSQPKEAIAEAEAVARAHPNHPFALFCHAQTLRLAGDLAGGLLMARKYAGQLPSDVLLQQEMAQAEFQAGNVEAAIEILRRLASVHADKIDAHLQLARVFYQNGDLAGAEDAARRAIALAPNSGIGHSHLALALAARGQLDEAGKEVQRALEGKRLTSLAHIANSDVLRRKGQLDKAIVAGQAAVESDASHNTQSITVLGLALLARGKKEGLKELQRAVELAPASPNPSLLEVPALAAAVLEAHPDNAALRQQASQWLKEDVALWSKRLSANRTLFRPGVHLVMGRLLSDPRFAAVREKTALAKLPDEERTAWERLWQQIESLRKDAEK